ncbi:hypothetical protein THAOC_10093 [Thalassiosira oceanica]|uniref:MYND-type domain-containing protein n=1 Tax=Thalassiosira oceanica TaxID=159749 RepID=K0SUW4_THAOC|nr:hypothetical protein THAOC_10093 [Thalassiosira oceanica]|eukprot:EJK68704.1 hypothetical protein THAOC_10093 [Thalassiosira oceanica]
MDSGVFKRRRQAVYCHRVEMEGCVLVLVGSALARSSYTLALDRGARRCQKLPNYGTRNYPTRCQTVPDGARRCQKLPFLLAKYCGVDCQRAHRKQHKKACKQRASELNDEQLYSQGHERPEGDFCPICTLPIPLPMHDHSGLYLCCMKRICSGCFVAAGKRGMLDCPFCRTPMKDDDADNLAMIMSRVAKKHPQAINHLGHKYCHGRLGLQKDMRKGVELYTEAAELGSIEALCHLGYAHVTGCGVEQDKAKGIHFWRKAAMRGHVLARHNLGIAEAQEGNSNSAVRHLLISAKMGSIESVEKIKKMVRGGVATKEQYTEALKGYQDAAEEMKSPEREEVKSFSVARFSIKSKKQ